MHDAAARTIPLRNLPIFIAVALVVGVTWVATASGSELRRSAIVQAVERCRPSVVNIHGEKTVSASYDDVAAAGETPRRVNGMGTGVVLDERGYIVTNHHVVQGVRRIQVTLADGTTYIAQLVSYDKATDLAIIKINASEKLPVVTIGTSSDLMPGETVIAVGNAYGYEHTVTQGIVSALHRTVQVSDNQQYTDLIQTDASINPGNSGGPLLNIDGEMIGVNVAVRAGAQGIGFAIPVDKVLEITSDLLSAQKVDNNYHGIEIDLAGANAAGVLVKRVDEDSPAAKAGIKPGDRIKVVEEQEIHLSLDFQRALIERKVGEELELKIERDQEPLKVSLVMASHRPQGAATEDRAWDVLGMKLRTLSVAQMRDYNSRYRGGLSVVAVRPNSPAAEQGIREGDVLVGMHIWETVSMENITYVLNRPDLDQFKPLKFYIVRGQETLFGHLTLAESPKRR